MSAQHSKSAPSPRRWPLHCSPRLSGGAKSPSTTPLAKLLPPGTNVPSFNGIHITVGNIVTHTSGLPSFPWRTTDLSNPYARLTEGDLLDTLAKTQLKRAPGSQREYSNFALMVLSYALAKRSGRDFETLLRERLLSPLGMDDTFIVTRPSAVRVAEGHFSNGRPTGPWDVRVDLAGAGGVRATLLDMVRYLASAIGNESRSHAPIWSMQPPIVWRTVRDTFTEVVVVELRETTRPAHLADLNEHQDQMGLVGP